MYYIVRFDDEFTHWFRGDFESVEQAEEFANDEYKELRRQPGYSKGEYLNWSVLKCEEV